MYSYSRNSYQSKKFYSPWAPSQSSSRAVQAPARAHSSVAASRNAWFGVASAQRTAYFLKADPRESSGFTSEAISIRDANGHPCSRVMTWMNKSGGGWKKGE